MSSSQWRRIEECMMEQMPEQSAPFLALGRFADCESDARLVRNGGRSRKPLTEKDDWSCGWPGLDAVERRSCWLPVLESNLCAKEKPLLLPSVTWIGQDERLQVRLRKRLDHGGLLDFRSNAATSDRQFARSSLSRWRRVRRRVQTISDTASSSAQLVSTGGHGEEAGSSKELGSSGWLYRTAQASMESRVLMKSISTWERASIGAAAGGVAGAFTYACLHPLDTIKTRLQARGAAELYSGPVDVAIKILKSKGILGFYSGISAVIFGSMLSSAVYFGTCEFGKALLAARSSCPPLLIPPISAAMGNIVSSAILVPKEVITQRMQAGAVGRSWEVFLRTVQKEGVRGLYAGYSAALSRNLPASVLSFSSFEYLKAGWLNKTGKANLEPWESVTSGALAGVISAALTTPLDVAKTRLMTQAKRSVLLGTDAAQASLLAEAELTAKIAASTYKGLSSTLHRIWLEEGWLGLTRGVGPRLLYSACFSALGYFAFETAKITLLKHHLDRKGSLLKMESLEVPTAPLAVS